MYNKFVLLVALWRVSLDKPNPMKGQNMETTRIKYEFKPLFITSDSWPFWQQPDGTLCDTPNPKDSDLTFDSLDHLYNIDDETVFGSVSDHARLASDRIDHDYYSDPQDKVADIELVLWYKGTL